MSETHSNSASKPWREVLQLRLTTPDRDAIYERYRQLSRDAADRLRDEHAAIKRACEQALAELFPEDV